ncbi:MAG: nucleotide exchange factor GrpE [Clostridia bacterium]|nr:nucleotide exchange factor GrpE [Clostridia bacterium]
MSKKKPMPTEETPETADTPLEDGAVDAQEAVQEDLESLKAQLEAARKQSEEYLNMAQRVQADFENFRRRNNAARAESFEEGARAFITTILPVMDNFERALAVDSADEALKEGLAMVYRQLSDALEKRGVTAIDRLGEKFDPSLENAVMQGESSEGEPGTVCAVLQKGYRLGDFVLRHAMVKVVSD